MSKLFACTDKNCVSKAISYSSPPPCKIPITWYSDAGIQVVLMFFMLPSSEKTSPHFSLQEPEG